MNVKIKRLKFKTRLEYRKWLEKNCLTHESIWMEFYKDGSEGISYNDALEESLCFGWIDSLIKRIDERVYVRKFSKRKPRSNWSALNRKKAEELIDRGLMTEHGMKAIETAQNNGQWSKSDEREEIVDVDGLRRIIMNRTGLGDAYDRLSEPLKKHYSTVYFSARREDTRNKRLELIMEYMKTKKRFM